ncbi:alpha/beta hydrolase [Sulfurimonas sp. MAG313]|nr:alpha/beta hydrolase [Sulfurimonas sp. MAG313]MDF1880282.1 alpha/beta hydrolase [Sulfurimonas sp. MAG313]
MAIKTFQHEQHTYNISYEIINPQAKHDLIVLHGWGSNKEIMKQAFESHLKGFRHIYIDLPGFGRSTNDVVMNTAEYTRVLEVFFELIAAKKEVILGHSFGGKIATLLNPKLLVLLSSAGIKLPKSLKVLTKIRLTKIANSLGIGSFTRLFRAQDAKELNTIMYETFKKVVDEDFSKEFENFPNKALVCWGEDDTATPLIAGENIAKLIKKSHFTTYQGDHFFFLNRAKAISKQIEKEYLK